MKHKKTELDVDFIGGQGPAFELTKEDEMAISKFIREHKAKEIRKSQTKRRKQYKTSHAPSIAAEPKEKYEK
ncbi:MAG: hypothetical protein HY063_10610 [Bacteroidetes bacterium]|nr:hypothetical protein [Bacteroidota bacterium]